MGLTIRHHRLYATVAIYRFTSKTISSALDMAQLTKDSRYAQIKPFDDLFLCLRRCSLTQSIEDGKIVRKFQLGVTVADTCTP